MQHFSKFLILALTRTKIYWVIRKWFELCQFYLTVNIAQEIQNLKLAFFSCKEILFSTKRDFFIFFLLIFPLAFLQPLISYSEVWSAGDYYMEVLSIIASIGGVIIALFHTVSMSLASSVYSKMPQEAKSLLNNEPVGSAFVKALTFLTFTCLILLVLRYYNLPPIPYIIPVLTAVTGILIFSLMKISKRMFYFTDPTILGSSILMNFKNFVQCGTIKRLGWKNKHFQNHYGKQVALSIRSLGELVKALGNSNHLEGESSCYIAKICFIGIKFYVQHKKYIPIDSFFHHYGKKIKFKSWYSKPDTSSVRVFVPSEQVSEFNIDRNWVEARLTTIAERCISINLKNKNIDAILKILVDCADAIKVLADNFEFDFAIEIIKKLENALLNDENFFDARNKNRVTDYHRISEMISYMRSHLLVSLYNNIRELSLPRVRASISKVRWGNGKGFYALILSSCMKKDFLEFDQKVQFEIDIESRRITPDCYIQKFVFQIYINTIDKYINKVLDFIISGASFFPLAEESNHKANPYFPLIDGIVDHIGRTDTLFAEASNFFSP